MTSAPVEVWLELLWVTLSPCKKKMFVVSLKIVEGEIRRLAFFALVFVVYFILRNIRLVFV